MQERYIGYLSLKNPLFYLGASQEPAVSPERYQQIMNSLTAKQRETFRFLSDYENEEAHAEAVEMGEA